MTLPPEIPEDLRAVAVNLPELGEWEGAWPQPDALSVIDSLKGTTVAIAHVTVFDKVHWGYAPSEVEWAGERQLNEPDTDYAGRTRSEAAKFIQECESASETSLFVLMFPMEKDAA